MKKIMRVGTIDTGNGRRASVYIVAENRNDYLSITGVIGPLPSGNALAGCGQIDMDFSHRSEADDDKRYANHLIKPADFNFAPDWYGELWLDLLDVWKEWHLKKAPPQSVLDFINSLPDTDKEPAWC
ncbi:hypothetical protein LCGC14_1063000 [marine sediment metagenome]|uniref:Uncharacterized protein n=1 Tax=marine sediment metagenome TaxID=412755 RepID=A0A0F9N7K6_9ZZZZ